MVSTVVKRCTKCGTEIPIEHFPRNKLTRDGRGSWCKNCVAANTATYSKTSRGKLALKSNKTTAIFASAGVLFPSFGKERSLVA
jgi:hypothetical protein